MAVVLQRIWTLQTWRLRQHFMYVLPVVSVGVGIRHLAPELFVAVGHFFNAMMSQYIGLSIFSFVLTKSQLLPVGTPQWASTGGSHLAAGLQHMFIHLSNGDSQP